MPTYAQLQAESWWGQEIVTDELRWLGAEIRAALGVGADAIGTKGNNVHLNGSHRSQDWILNSRYCTSRTYTVQSGLTAAQRRHIAALDVTPKSTADMLAISQRIDRATRAGQLEEVIAWYGNTNNDQRVDGYDNIRNAAATSDSSHLWHLHIGFDRRVLTSMDAMRRVLAVLTGTEVYTVGDSQLINNAERAATALVAGTEVIKFEYPWNEQSKAGFPNPLVALTKKVDGIADDVATVKASLGAPHDGEVLEAVPIDLDALADKVAARLGDTFADLVADKLAARLAS